LDTHARQAAALPHAAPPAHAMPWSRAVTCVCFEVTGPEITAGPWQPWPLPVALPNGRPADRRGRASYFQSRAAGVLYGAQDGSGPQVRWHQSAGAIRIEEGSVLGIELLPPLPLHPALLRRAARHP
jgi:hypothetical protein